MRKITNRSRGSFIFSALLTTSVLAALALTSACATLPEPPYRTEGTAEPVVAKAAWLENLHTGLTEELCSEDQLFRSCYTVSEQDCRERVSDIAAACESEYQPALPDALSDVEAVRWGGRIGKCTGEGLFTAVSANYTQKASEACDKLLSEM